MKTILAIMLVASVAVAGIPAVGQQKLTLHHHDAAHQTPGTIVVRHRISSLIFLKVTAAAAVLVAAVKPQRGSLITTH